MFLGRGFSALGSGGERPRRRPRELGSSSCRAQGPAPLAGIGQWVFLAQGLAILPGALCLWAQAALPWMLET